MGRGSRGDVDEIEILTCEEFGGVGVGRAAELMGGSQRTLVVHIARGDEFDLGHLRPCMQMILGEESTADQGESVRAAHSSTSLSGSMIHSLHDPTYIRAPGNPACSMAKTFCAAVTPDPQ